VHKQVLKLDFSFEKSPEISSLQEVTVSVGPLTVVARSGRICVVEQPEIGKGFLEDGLATTVRKGGTGLPCAVHDG
jgi:hypothetical protein